MDFRDAVREAKTLLDAAHAADEESKRGVSNARLDLSRARRSLARKRRELEELLDQAKAIDPNDPRLVEIEAVLSSSGQRLAELTKASSRRGRAQRTRIAPLVAEGHVVYFVQAKDGGPIKIGTSRNVEQRMLTLQAASPVELVLLATVAGDARAEAALHRRLAKHRLHGEWFDDVDEVHAAMREVLQ